MYPPARFENAANQLRAEIERGGEVPVSCVALVNAINDFCNEWDLYVNGHMKAGGVPHRSLWKAYRQMIVEREGIRIVPPKRPAPVHILIEQGVSHNQIALHIYGHNGEGPFLVDGQIDSTLIEKEAKKPGSVVPKDWIHPSEVERLQVETEANKEHLARIEDQIEAAPEDEPETEQKPPKPAAKQDEPTEDETPAETDETPQISTIEDAVIQVEAANSNKSPSDLLKIVKKDHAELAEGLTVKRVAEILKDQKAEATA